MRISVAIPTFRGANYIRATLESIVAQTRLPSEIVISDDSSDDGTVAAIVSFAARSPLPIHLHHHTRSGLSANYLNAVARCSGDLVLVADQDDPWLPERVATAARALESDRTVSLVSLDSTVVDETLTPLGTTLRGGRAKSQRESAAAARDDFRFYLVGARLDAHTLGLRANVVEILRTQLTSETDGLWFENLVSNIAMSVGRLAYLPEPLVLYRQHGAQHAGYSRRTLLEHTSRSSQVQALRLEHLRSMLHLNRARALFPEAEGTRRLRMLEQFRQFQDLRNSPRLESAWLLEVAKAALNGRYSEFTASALRSIAKDLYRAFRARRS